MFNAKELKILGLFLIFFAGFLLGTYYSHESVGIIEYDVPNDIIKTVAHVTIDNEDYEQIYSNAEDDVAYYRYIGKRDLLSIGDTVYLYDGSEGTVTSTSINGFTLDMSCPVIKGLSGMAILDSEGKQIGYISQLLQNDQVFCIWS